MKQLALGILLILGGLGCGVCGDGRNALFGEECDDGNESNNDLCTNFCQVAVCGDGFTSDQDGGTEECDDENDDNSDDCLNNCKAAVCGDGVTAVATEECDGDDLNGQSCTDLGFSGGNLSCAVSCAFDLNGCTP